MAWSRPLRKRGARIETFGPGAEPQEETCRPLRKRGARIETAFGLLAAALSFQVAPCESEGRGLKRNGAMASKSVGQVAPCESEGRGLKQRRLQCWDWDGAEAPCESEGRGLKLSVSQHSGFQSLSPLAKARGAD